MMTKRFDVIALGELLIDFTENGTSPQGNPVMERNGCQLPKCTEKVYLLNSIGNH